MDGSHVALVSMNLDREGFESFKVDKDMVLGLNITLLAKVMRLADMNDSITMSACDKD